jgi:hypothetical protein
MWCDAFLNSLAIRSFHFLKRGIIEIKFEEEPTYTKKMVGEKKLHFPLRKSTEVFESIPMAIL